MSPITEGRTVFLILLFEVAVFSVSGLNATSDGSPGEHLNTDVSEPDCSNYTCVRKCCPLGQVYSLASPHYFCVEPLAGEPAFEPIFQYKDGRPGKPDRNVTLIFGMPHDVSNCSAGPLPSHRTASLQRDGRLYTPHDDTFWSNTEYCLEIYRQEEEPTMLHPFTCYEKYVETGRVKFRYYAHSICLILSIISLSLLVFFHLCIPSLRDLSGLCLLSHVCSLLTGNLALVTATLWSSINYSVCVALGIILHASFIATYMWLTIMCFDIWRYVRMSIRGIPFHAQKFSDRTRFRFYCAAVWGATALISGVTCLLQFLPDELLPAGVIRPHFGLNRCFIIDDDTNLLVYFFCILGTLCLVNICMVGKTVHYLYQGGASLCCINKRTTDSESSVFNATHLDVFWQRFQIFGMTILLWTTEVLSWKIPPKYLWEPTDLLNTLQGVIILIIFLKQKKKRDLLRDLFMKMAGQAQERVRKITLSEETSSSYISGIFNSNKLEGSDPETVDKIRKLSRLEETVASTMAKSVSQNKIDLVCLQDLHITQTPGQLQTESNAAFVEVDLESENEGSSDIAKDDGPCN